MARRRRRRTTASGLDGIILIIMIGFLLITVVWKLILALILLCFMIYFSQRFWKQHKNEALIRLYGENHSTEQLLMIINKLLDTERYHLSPGEKSERKKTSLHYRKLLDQKKSGFVYFIRETGGGRIKIGKARDPYERITKGFGVKLPYPLQLVHLLESKNDLLTEKLFHQHFRHKRVHGEWFHLSEGDVQWVQNQRYPSPIMTSLVHEKDS
ncbi:GIY-YIG nuclease family protein [Fictibacillus enclensis]|uniref:GIY-YIG nuclease family protein n=1 Tax=Fictibacillus enclensis TaxID=1017270 RepID=UPI0025A0B315|nr:GIY-YIG nuclease family protein [Fictibacillus enclensis]MDM5335733.1 GIY-YIG nuclease family protein [Fictibacillus enclensis]